MTDYRLYDMPMTPAAAPRVQASVGIGGWILILLLVVLVSAAVSGALAFMAMRAQGARAEAERAMREAEQAMRQAEERHRAESAREAVPAVDGVRWVERSATEGTISIPYNDGEPGPNRQQAYRMFNEAFGARGWEIVWEAEVPVGGVPPRDPAERRPQRVETEYHIHVQTR